MALNPYSHGKSYPQEMAESGIYGTTPPPSNGSRYTPGWNYLTRTCEYDVGRTRTNAATTLPQGQNQQGSTGELRQIRRRLPGDRQNERTAGTRSQTADRRVPK